MTRLMGGLGPVCGLGWIKPPFLLTARVTVCPVHWVNSDATGWNGTIWDPVSAETFGWFRYVLAQDQP
jgi:hypothetical protein